MGLGSVGNTSIRISSSRKRLPLHASIIRLDFNATCQKYGVKVMKRRWPSICTLLPWTTDGFYTKLHTGKAEDPICCSLLEVELKQTQIGWAQPEYYAISYVWCTDPERYPLDCNGRVLFVTASVLDVLYRLRNSNENRLLWVDAVCIDQDDVRERAAQVRIMRFIYFLA